MINYLAPKHIAEYLGLTKLRKSMPDESFYLLSERDIVGYGKQKAIAEGAIPFASYREKVSVNVVTESDSSEGETVEETTTEKATDSSTSVAAENDSSGASSEAPVEEVVESDSSVAVEEDSSIEPEESETTIEEEEGSV